MEDARPRYSKRLRSGTRRRYQDDGISDDEIEGKRTFDLDEKLKSERFTSSLVKRMDGKDFTFEYIQREGLRDPVIFEKPDGLGIQMPDADFSVNDVKLFVGSRRVVDVMDVTTQKGMEMSMAQWRRYYETPPAEREKLYNVISLEFSHTKLENLVKRPASVDVVDWVDNMWPRHLKERQRDSTNAIIDMKYPKVQKYCLMSVEGCFTDFHIDFGGTSVWYHVLRGGKVFWLIPPTPQNLELYENWVLSGKQGDIFLGDKATDCQRIELKQGYTFMIPSGWIHAVYTPVDALVFGGNFLHSFNIPMQLHIYNIEDRTRVPPKFRYPFYYEMCWYVMERYLYCLTNTSHLTPDFQKHSLGIGLQREDAPSPDSALNDPIKEEEQDEEDEKLAPTPPPTRPGVKVHLTPFELEGLWNLLGKLESLPSHKKCVPAGIHNAPALLHDIRNLLQEHANDDPNLAYTGTPIVRWPKRPSWYQPPPPPPLLLNRPRLSSSLAHPLPPPRPVKPPSAMSMLRRRRVRCRRCAACLRTECGDCNYCRDMKKFGGPGRLKQTCLLRQCLAPGLPLSAVCAVCGEGTQDSEEPADSTLMECSNCAQIAHPNCLKVPGEGVVNKDLPSCWECPKCTLEKGSTSESSSSDDDDSVESDHSLSPAASPSAKRSHKEWGVGGATVDEGGVVRPSRHRRPPLPLTSLSQLRSRRVAPPPSHRLLLQQQQQNRRRAGALELRLRKRIKMERDKISPSKRKSSSLDPRSPKLCGWSQDSGGYEGGDRVGEGGRRPSLRGSPRRLQRTGRAGRRGLWRAGQGGRLAPNSPLGLSPRSDASTPNGRRERGRGVRLRGGGRAQRRRAEREEQEDKHKKEEEEQRERDREEVQRMGRLDKENRPHRRRGRAREEEEESSEARGRDKREEDEEEEEEEEEEGGEESRVEPDPVLLVSDLSEELVNGSYVTVTLQRPPKAKRDPGAIVPKLEAAVAPRGPRSCGYIQRKSLQRPQKHQPAPSPGPACGHSEVRVLVSRLDRKMQGACPSTSFSSSATPTLPPSVLSLPSLRDGGNEPGCEKEVWVSVFRYLTREELCLCMTVCKSWYKWSCDKRLWTRIDLSRCRSISPQALSGIIKRQPVSLDLSWTSISKKQLTWLINRLPGLKDLIVSGCSWSSVSALSSPSCPLLRSLDLCWAEGVKDIQIRDLLTPPGCDNRSKLRNMLSFRLAGLEISDSTLRLIIRHMPLLARLDLSHCRGVRDQSVNLLTAVGCSTRNTLTEINLAGCSKLTDGCLLYLKRVSSLSLLDLRGCKHVTRQACESFIAELSVNTLYCLSEDKLIQRIS